VLSFTPPERLTDARDRPYFLWDCELTLDEFRKALADPDPEVRAYLVGKLMRQAKPDDVFLFVRPREIRALWPSLTRYLGRTREFWSWVEEALEAKNQRILLIKADEDAAYSSVMTAMDQLRSVGLEDIGLITERRTNGGGE
jgi:hypothetical protein